MRLSTKRSQVNNQGKLEKIKENSTKADEQYFSKESYPNSAAEQPGDYSVYIALDGLAWAQAPIVSRKQSHTTPGIEKIAESGKEYDVRRVIGHEVLRGERGKGKIFVMNKKS